MHIVFRDMEKWREENKDLLEKFEETYEVILAAAAAFGSVVSGSVKEKIKEKTGEEMKTAPSVIISEQRLKQALIDAYDDLNRLKKYHRLDAPNPIKEMSYIVYWFLRHKPMIFDSEDLIVDSPLSEMAKIRLLFINEEFCVKLLIGAAFPKGARKEGCTSCREEGERQLGYFKKFLLYYLVYRMESPKSLEAILLATTIFPIWEVDEMIWSDPSVWSDGQ